MVLEPWEERVLLVGTTHHYTERRVIRTWGRRRLRLVEPLLPFAEGVDIYLKGRALPSFYAVRLPGIKFLLGLSGWTGQRFTDSAGLDLLGDTGSVGDAPGTMAALDLLRERGTLQPQTLARERPMDLTRAARMLQRLVREGRAIYDLEARNFRHRELFENPLEEKRLYPPDLRRESMASMLARGLVTVERCEPEEQRQVKRLRNPRTGNEISREVIYRNWRVTGRAGEVPEVQIVIGDEGSILFGLCPCSFFLENGLSKGPCAHMAALYRASESQRVDLPVSQESEAAPTGHAYLDPAQD
jgi:hypothetical protein